MDGITDEIGDDYNEAFSSSGKHDDLFNEAVELIRRTERVSISFIQRNLQIGYNKAAKLVEQMEKEGIVSPPDRTGKRELLG
jgi:S-DNA-T family DNA segregation ATPase FtsK/SpoIIIE